MRTAAAARSTAGVEEEENGRADKDERKKIGEESKEMVLVSNLERLSLSAATKPKTVLR